MSLSKEEDRIMIERRLTELEVKTEAIDDKLKELIIIKSELSELISKLNKYERRWGNVVMIGTAVWAVFATFKDEIMKLLVKLFGGSA